MIINGIDLDKVKEDQTGPKFPDTVPGRVVQIDADFLAYMVSYERKDEPVSWETMQYNTSVAVERIRRQAGAEQVHMHLTPSSSDKGGRPDIAIQKQYQANRIDKEKPQKLHLVREWMGKNFPATLHQLCEADDGMSSAQYAAHAEGKGNLSIICSKDKDLRMVRGLHLNWDEGTISETTAFGDIWMDVSKSSPKVGGYGTKFFWAQMLMGDAADNIQGLPFVCGPNVSKPKRVGPTITYSMLCDIHNDKDAFEYVKLQYERTGKDVGFKHWNTGEVVPWQLVLVSEMKLLWMRRDKHNANDVLLWLKEVTT